MRGREMFYEGDSAEQAASYMQECYAEEGVDRSGEPAVLVRASAADSREVFHGNAECGLIAGKGRRLDDARWMLIGDAREVGYEPCQRCGLPT
ncbi:hypothetical protein RKD37_001745 [Streptomyces ambofaciens]